MTVARACSSSPLRTAASTRIGATHVLTLIGSPCMAASAAAHASWYRPLARWSRAIAARDRATIAPLPDDSPAPMMSAAVADRSGSVPVHATNTGWRYRVDHVVGETADRGPQLMPLDQSALSEGEVSQVGVGHRLCVEDHLELGQAPSRLAAWAARSSSTSRPFPVPHRRAHARRDDRVVPAPAVGQVTCRERVGRSPHQVDRLAPAIADDRHERRQESVDHWVGLVRATGTVDCFRHGAKPDVAIETGDEHGVLARRDAGRFARRARSPNLAAASRQRATARSSAFGIPVRTSVHARSVNARPAPSPSRFRITHRSSSACAWTSDPPAKARSAAANEPPCPLARRAPSIRPLG